MIHTKAEIGIKIVQKHLSVTDTSRPVISFISVANRSVPGNKNTITSYTQNQVLKTTNDGVYNTKFICNASTKLFYLYF